MASIEEIKATMDTASERYGQADGPLGEAHSEFAVAVNGFTVAHELIELARRQYASAIEALDNATGHLREAQQPVMSASTDVLSATEGAGVAAEDVRYQASAAHGLAENIPWGNEGDRVTFREPPYFNSLLDTANLLAGQAAQRQHISEELRLQTQHAKHAAEEYGQRL